MKIEKKILPFAIAVAIAFSTPANAQFEPSNAKVFVDYPNLIVEPYPGRISEIAIYAVINSPIALYTITIDNRFSTGVLGTFQCAKEFTILKTSSNNFYDIKCVDLDVFDKPLQYILKADEDGIYQLTNASK